MQNKIQLADYIKLLLYLTVLSIIISFISADTDSTKFENEINFLYNNKNFSKKKILDKLEAEFNSLQENERYTEVKDKFSKY